MSDDTVRIDLNGVKAFATALSPWAHLATVGTITVERALVLKQYGIGGAQRWSA